MKSNEIILNDDSMSTLSMDECAEIIGGGLFDAIAFVCKAVGVVVGGTAAALYESYSYGISHPAGINAGMENVH